MKPKIISINISKEKGTKKEPIDKAYVLKDKGLMNDVHAGNWHRQVSFLALESIEKMRAKGLNASYGDFAENITTLGIDLISLPVGTKLKLGNEVEVVITQIGKKCHLGCEIFKLTGDCVMPKEGIFAKVLKGGTISIADEIRIEEP
ncbi:MAG: MOSC domain-containing protein [Deltaproteobacteria bacterium]|nr:MOSC domain-containing protein [Deltaproteobacteria bacterium]